VDYNLKNRVIKNVLSQDQIDRIYKLVNSCSEDKIKAPNNYGQLAFFIDEFDSRESGAEDIYLSIENMLKSEYNIDLKIEAIQFVRYTTKSGNAAWLPPHYDKVFKKPMITVDIQMNSNLVWPVYVDGIPYTLKNNEALVFSGTHQIHWRPKIELQDDQYLDMIFCHLEDTQADEISDKHRVDMKLLSTKYLNEYV
jgi:hypothetical protein